MKEFTDELSALKKQYIYLGVHKDQHFQLEVVPYYDARDSFHYHLCESLSVLLGNKLDRSKLNVEQFWIFRGDIFPVDGFPATNNLYNDLLKDKEFVVDGLVYHYMQWQYDQHDDKKPKELVGKPVFIRQPVLDKDSDSAAYQFLSPYTGTWEPLKAASRASFSISVVAPKAEAQLAVQHDSTQNSQQQQTFTTFYQSMNELLAQIQQLAVMSAGRKLYLQSLQYLLAEVMKLLTQLNENSQYLAQLQQAQQQIDCLLEQKLVFVNSSPVGIDSAVQDDIATPKQITSYHYEQQGCEYWREVVQDKQQLQYRVDIPQPENSDEHQLTKREKSIILAMENLTRNMDATRLPMTIEKGTAADAKLCVLVLAHLGIHHKLKHQIASAPVLIFAGKHYTVADIETATKKSPATMVNKVEAYLKTLKATQEAISLSRVMEGAKSVTMFRKASQDKPVVSLAPCNLASSRGADGGVIAAKQLIAVG